MQPTPAGHPLVSAVRAGNTQAVWKLLAEDADPDVAGDDGLPVLCTAVAAYDHAVAELLVGCGADPDRLLPDGTTPLLRAVDLGSPAMLDAVLGSNPGVRIPQAGREKLLALARDWYETGAAEVLRRRTGASGPAESIRVEDDEVHHVDEVTLGGVTVRAGHGAVLTGLEASFGVPTPVDELVDRAVRHADAYHVDWFASCLVLSRRPGRRTWSAVVSLRHHPSPAHRLVAAGYLWFREMSVIGPPSACEEEEYDLLATWATEETDGAVLAQVLDSYTCHAEAGQEAVRLLHTAHPDARVRREVPHCFVALDTSLTSAATTSLLTLARDPDPSVRIAVGQALRVGCELDPETREALLALVRDPEEGVRVAAVEALSESHDRTAAVSDAFAALLDEGNQLLRLEAAYGLARRDDPRTEAAYERVGPLGAGFEDDHRASGLWHWRTRNRPRRP